MARFRATALLGSITSLCSGKEPTRESDGDRAYGFAAKTETLAHDFPPAKQANFRLARITASGQISREKRKGYNCNHPLHQNKQEQIKAGSL